MLFIANKTRTGVHTVITHPVLVAKGIVKNVKWSRYRPGVAQRVGRGIALLFHDRGTRRGWAVSSTPRPHFTSGKEPVPIVQEAGWAPGPVWTGGKSRSHRDSIPNIPARSSVAIPTELPGPQNVVLIQAKNKKKLYFLYFRPSRLQMADRKT